MWLFKRKKTDKQTQPEGLTCPRCRSANTAIITHHGSDQDNHIRTWRGQRYLTCRCLDCGEDFYADSPSREIEERWMENERTIDDEEALRTAENELKRETDEEGDHRCG